ncbi:PD-(D/E)XK nuclease family protein [Longispora sp. K20-0274]|uniref:PD-(D/E)XK nuclease family protein n=1 Tax=Longispora sp. K20-0274 TaxID=3088255 RepID=UPI00399AA8E0
MTYRLVRRPAATHTAPVLDPAQAAVVAHPGPLLVVGAPGTGKTTTLLAAVAARIADGAEPDRVLVWAFNRHAATGLRDGVAARSPGVTEPLVRTPHGYAFSLLRLAAARRGDPTPKLITGPEQDLIIRELLRGALEDGREDWPVGLRPALLTRGFATELRDLLLRAVERGVSSRQLAAWGREHGRPDWVSAARFLDEYIDVRLLRDPGGYDPAELIRSAIAELREDPDLLAAERARLRHVYVDDAQDLDPAQLQLLHLVTDRPVGFADPDSVTFTFRGADPAGLRGFAPETVTLGTNWRTGGTLLAATQRVGRRLRGAARHRAVASRGSGSYDVALLHSASEEASYVAYRLRAAHLLDRVPWSRMAVIVRSTAAALGPLRRAMTMAGVPVETAAADLPLPAQPVVRALLTLLDCAAHPENLDEDTAVALLHSPLGGADPLAERRLRQGLAVLSARRPEPVPRIPAPRGELNAAGAGDAWSDAGAWPEAEPHDAWQEAGPDDAWLEAAQDGAWPEAGQDGAWPETEQDRAWLEAEPDGAWPEVESAGAWPESGFSGGQSESAPGVEDPGPLAGPDIRPGIRHRHGAGRAAEPHPDAEPDDAHQEADDAPWPDEADVHADLWPDDAPWPDDVSEPTDGNDADGPARTADPEPMPVPQSLAELIENPPEDAWAEPARRLHALLTAARRAGTDAGPGPVSGPGSGSGQAPEEAHSTGQERSANQARSGDQARSTSPVPGAGTVPNAEEALWAVWSASGLADRWERAALAGGERGAAADRDLDAVVALFEAAGRFVDRLPGAGAHLFVDHVLGQELPGDSLAPTADRGEAVRILTAHSAKGLEWDVVAVAGVQEGVWPNLKPRGSLLGSEQLVDVVAERDPSVVALLDEERRLFYVAATRARKLLIATAVAGKEEQPSRFLDELRVRSENPEQQVVVEYTPLPRALTLPGLVADLRRRLPDEDAAQQLAALADAGVPGAHPDDWWGLRDLSDARPMALPGERVRVSPSTVETALTCGLRWLLSRHGGDASSAAGSIGTLVHYAAELSARDGITRAEIFDEVRRRFAQIDTGAKWYSRRQWQDVEGMIDKLLTWTEGRAPRLVGVEQAFRIDFGDDVELVGRVDRLERDEHGRLVVYDFKTGSAAENAETSKQLATYQAAVEAGAFPEGEVSGGAALVRLRLKTDPEQRQTPLSEAEDPGWGADLVTEAGKVVGGATVLAIVNEKCRQCPVRVCCPLHAKGVTE